MQERRIELLVLLVVAFATACSLARTTPRFQYYTITVPGDPPALPAPVELRSFQADEPYGTARMAYRSSPYRIDYYTYHRWAAEPTRLLQYAVRDHLARAETPKNADPFTLQLRILRIEEVDTDEGREGALSVEATVERKGRVLSQRAYTETEPVEAKTPDGVAAALSRALGRIVDRIVDELPAS